MTHTYDRFGNRWQERLTAGSGIQPSYAFDANNHIVGGVSYDAAAAREAGVALAEKTVVSGGKADSNE